MIDVIKKVVFTISCILVGCVISQYVGFWFLFVTGFIAGAVCSGEWWDE